MATMYIKRHEASYLFRDFIFQRKTHYVAKWQKVTKYRLHRKTMTQWMGQIIT